MIRKEGPIVCAETLRQCIIVSEVKIIEKFSKTIQILHCYIISKEKTYQITGLSFIGYTALMFTALAPFWPSLISNSTA
jgi:hypothetical protein